jgi:hypothetical protein
VELRLDVHDKDNSTTALGTLSEAYGRSLICDVRDRGAATFALDEASTTDLALIDFRRVIRPHVDYGSGWVALPAYLIDDMPRVVAADVPSRVVRCQGLLGWLGYDRGGGTLWPRGGLNGRDPRLFGWQGLDFDETGWVTPFDFGTQAAPDPGIKNWVGRPEGWMDPRAYRLYGIDLIWDAGTSTWNHPGGGATTLFRQKITVPRAGDYVLEVNGENYQVWLDGADGVSLSTRGAGAMTSRRVIDLAAGELQFAGQATNYGVMTRPSDNVSWLMWSLAEVDADGNPGEVVARSTPSTVVCVYEPDPWPGVTAGYILDVALTEDLARHAGRPWTWDFTDALDSYGQAWTTLLSHEFRMETLGRLQQELSGLLPLEVWAEADGTIRAAPRRGTDRTATVTIANPFGLDLTGEGPRLTRALYQTPAGFGATGGANEATYGVMEDVLTLGTGLDARAVRDSVVRFRNERSTPYNQASIELPDDVRPFVDVFPGDTVTVSGVGPYRLMTFELADADSQPEWASFGVPDA